MVAQNSGITTPLSRESISGLTIRSGLGVLDNPPQLLNDLEIFTLLLWVCSFCRILMHKQLPGRSFHGLALRVRVG